MGSGSQGRLALAAPTALGNGPWLLNLSAWANMRGEQRQHGVYAGVAYQFGAAGDAAGGTYNPGAVPQAARAQLDDRLRRMSTQSDGVRGVAALGQVVTTQSKTEQKTTERRVSERVVTQKDEAPVVEPPVVEPPVVEPPTPPVEPPVVAISCTGFPSVTIDDNGQHLVPVVVGQIQCTDPLNRALTYAASISPNTWGTGFATGAMSVSVDASGNVSVVVPNFDDGGVLPYSVQWTVTPAGGTPTTGTSTFSIRDNE